MTKVIGNQFVDIAAYIDFDISDIKVPKQVYYPVLMEILSENEGQEAVKDAIRMRKNELSPKHILVADVFASVSYLLNLNYGIGNIDDIDHLGNRRLRNVGELLQNQFRIGLARMERDVYKRQLHHVGSKFKDQNIYYHPQSQTHEDPYYERRYHEPKRGHYQTSRKCG